jgi:hypothetical protein
MGRNIPAECLMPDCSHTQVECLPTDRATVVEGKKDERAFLLSVVPRPDISDVGSERFDCWRAERHYSVLSAFAVPDLNESVLQIQIGQFQID